MRAHRLVEHYSSFVYCGWVVCDIILQITYYQSMKIQQQLEEEDPKSWESWLYLRGNSDSRQENVTSGGYIVQSVLGEQIQLIRSRIGEIDLE